jgi:hypothetical protein
MSIKLEDLKNAPVSVCLTRQPVKNLVEYLGKLDDLEVEYILLSPNAYLSAELSLELGRKVSTIHSLIYVHDEDDQSSSQLKFVLRKTLGLEQVRVIIFDSTSIRSLEQPNSPVTYGSGCVLTDLREFFGPLAKYLFLATSKKIPPSFETFSRVLCQRSMETIFKSEVAIFELPEDYSDKSSDVQTFIQGLYA